MGPIDSWSLWDAPTLAVPLRSNKQVNIVLTCDFDMNVFLGLDCNKSFQLQISCFQVIMKTFIVSSSNFLKTSFLKAIRERSKVENSL